MINENKIQEAEIASLREALDAAAEEKISLLANVSHEVRTPMNMIIGMTEIAKTAADAAKISECLDKINAAAKHLLRIINDALDMSKIESNKYILYEEAFVFSDMLRNISDFNYARMQKKSQSLKIAAADNLPPAIIADELRLSQVLNNLIGASSKFTGDGGTIELSIKPIVCENQSARLLFSVSYQGDGGGAEKELSGVYKQGEAGQYDFSGSGLAVSQRIVGLMGGVIRVEDNSAFSFEADARVPLTEPESSLKTSADTGPHVNRSEYDFSGYTILLAEDVEINREVVVALLEKTGINIECAENGQTAFNMYFGDPDKYNMIYMDIQMPVLDGYGASQKIRAIDATVPIVAMTADALADDIRKCKRFGMDDHIAKPLDIDELLKKTDRYIRRKD